MVDTVKLSVPYAERPEWLVNVQKSSGYNANSGAFTATIKPSVSYKLSGLYLPQLQYVERPKTKRSDKTYDLFIELSLPKLLFGNNFDELTDDLFSAVVNELSKRIWAVYDVKVSPTDLRNATVARIDYSKNIVFTDYTPISTIVGTIANGDIPKTYDAQKTNYRNGGLIYHIHANIIDIVVYDKVADLRQAKVSDKRSVEKYNYTHLKLADVFEKNKNISIARFEIRLNTKRKIRKELKSIGVSDELRLTHVFSTDVCRQILLRHWEKITSQISKTELLEDKPSQILISTVNTKQGVKFAEASAFTIMQLLRKELQDERAVRNLIERQFSKNQYARLKKMGLSAPTKTQLTNLLYITKTIKEMKPVSITDFIE